MNRHLLPPILLALFALQSFCEVEPPKPVADFAYKPRVVQLPNEDLWALTLSVKNGTQTVVVQVSRDQGVTWSDQDPILHLDKSEGSWGGPEVLVGQEGEVHVFLTCDLSKGVDEEGLLIETDTSYDDLISDVLAAEALAALEETGNAADWYSKKVAEAVDTAAQWYPEIKTDLNARFAFLAALRLSFLV